MNRVRPSGWRGVPRLFDVAIRVLAGRGVRCSSEVRGRLEDLRTTGLSVESPLELHVGTWVSMRILRARDGSGAADPACLATTGIVRQVGHRAAGGPYLVGVAFADRPGRGA